MFNKYTLAVLIIAAGAVFLWNNSLEAGRHCGPRVSINFGALFCPTPPPCPVYRETHVYYPCQPRYVYSAPCYPCCPPPCEQVVIYDRSCAHYYPTYPAHSPYYR